MSKVRFLVLCNWTIVMILVGYCVVNYTPAPLVTKIEAGDYRDIMLWSGQYVQIITKEAELQTMANSSFILINDLMGETVVPGVRVPAPLGCGDPCYMSNPIRQIGSGTWRAVEGVFTVRIIANSPTEFIKIRSDADRMAENSVWIAFIFLISAVGVWAMWPKKKS